MRIRVGVIFVLIFLKLAIASAQPSKGGHPPNVKAASFSQIGSGVFDVYAYGAKGDGKTIDTKAIQATIDACHKAGGGRVYLHNGQFVSGTVYLKDNVILDIEAGAIFRASNDLEDFPIRNSNYQSYEGKRVTNKMLVYAEDAKNIGITGKGTIDGNGDHWASGPYGVPSFRLRPRIIHFRGCENIIIRDVKLYNSASWVQAYQSCENLVIDGITVDSRPNKDIAMPRFSTVEGRNNDGLDLIDCRRVRISNCYINSGDDGICLKSFSPDEGCRDITISNCIVSTNASAIKIGTETSGVFEDIMVQNCVIYDTRLDAISLATVDGARMERVTISGVSMRNIKGSAIFIRLGKRNRSYHKKNSVNKPILRDVIIEKIQGTGISSEYGCSITGIENAPVENITLQNINLRFSGGGKKEDSLRQIPKREKAYPSGKMFGILPAYGFFVRHAKNIKFKNVQLDFLEKDNRSALFCVDVNGLEISGLRANGTMQTPGLIRLLNTREVFVTACRSVSPISVLLAIHGERASDIVMGKNLLNKVARECSFEDKATETALKVFGRAK